MKTKGGAPMNTQMTADQIAREQGKRTASARYRHDEARALFERDWFRRWLFLQPRETRQVLETAYAVGYRTEYQELDPRA